MITRTASVMVVAILLSPETPAAVQECTRSSIGREPLPIARSGNQSFATLQATARITPRLLDGTSHPNGKIVFLPIGMSNTRDLWDGFVPLVRDDPTRHSSLKMPNTAQGSMAAEQWADPNCPCWAALLTKLGSKLSRFQVQAVFLMVLNAAPTLDAEPNATLWHERVNRILDTAYTLFPNLQVVYLSRGWYGGYDTFQDKTPEPHGFYEDARIQVAQDTYGGPIPSILGLSLWADGTHARYDGLTMECVDVARDGVHVSSVGKAKYGRHLYETLKADPATRGWLFR